MAMNLKNYSLYIKLFLSIFTMIVSYPIIYYFLKEYTSFVGFFIGGASFLFWHIVVEKTEKKGKINC
jgi:lipopolysaccharide export LptBFGC system permease protein LptF